MPQRRYLAPPALHSPARRSRVHRGAGNAMYLLRRLRQVAASTPERPAVVVGERSVGYGAFWRSIDACRAALAAHLDDRGFVPLWIESRLDGWVVSLAVRSLGLDPAIIRSEDELALFGNLPVAAFISLATQPPPFAVPQQFKHLRLEAPSSASIPASGALPPVPDREIWGRQVIFTSGTTGRYKMVRAEQGETEPPIVRRLASYEELGDAFRPFGANPGVSVLDLGLWTSAGNSWPIFTWCLGGAVHAVEGDLSLAFDWPGLTHVVATPWHLSRLTAMPEGAFRSRPDVQLVVTGGAVAPRLAAATRRRLSPRLLVTLASTEAGSWARTAIKSDEDLRWYRLDPRAVVEIIDDAGAVAPPGQLGRVRVRLRHERPHGYVGDAEGTAASFDREWFYPGDLGVLDGEGRIALSGRINDVIEIEGNKHPVESFERAIQDRLRCDAVCILTGEFDGEAERLHVFIETAAPIPIEALQAALSETLWGFPAARAHFVDALPRTSTGKIRRIDLAQRLFAQGSKPRT